MFLIDANILIEAKNRYYAFDVVPGFWDWLERSFQSGLVGSIEAVGKELERGQDELADWAIKHRSFFRPIDAAAVANFTALATWAQQQNFSRAALNQFSASAADFILVAFAAAHHHIVVTHEKANSGSKKRVKIPDACEALGVAYTDTFAMLRGARAQLILV